MLIIASMYFLQGLLLGISAAASPGPFQAYLLARALKGGWRRTWAAAFAPLISDGPVVLLVLLVLSVVPAWLLAALRLAGGFFLLYLAWGILSPLLRSKPDETAPEGGASPPQSGGKTLWQAAVMNALSPGPWIFWSTVAGPAFLQGWQAAPADGFGFLAGFYSAMLAVLSVLIAVFAVLGRARPRFVRFFHLVSGLLLAGFGLYQVGFVLFSLL